MSLVLWQLWKAYAKVVYVGLTVDASFVIEEIKLEFILQNFVWLVSAVMPADTIFLTKGLLTLSILRK